MVTCRLKCEKPDEIEYTLTVTMQAGQWERLRTQLQEAGFVWPANDLVRQIDNLLSQARKIYWPTIDGEGRDATERAAHAQSRV